MYIDKYKSENISIFAANSIKVYTLSQAYGYIMCTGVKCEDSRPVADSGLVIISN